MSVFPWGGHRGDTVEVRVRGEWLEGSYAAWFDEGLFKTRLLKVEEVAPDDQRQPIGTEKPKNPPREYRVSLEIHIDPKTRAGIYGLRIVTPHGITNSIRFPVVDEPVVVEAPGSHQTIDEAQAIAIPAIVNGRLGKPGEVDYYSFRAAKGEELEFQAIPGENLGRIIVSDIFDPQLSLYRPAGSWFDPHRPTQLLFEEQRSSTLIPVEAKGTYRFDADGQYYLEVSGMYGAGCSECSYQLRIVPRKEASALTAEIKPVDQGWVERRFDRPLDDKRLMALAARVGVAGTPYASLQKPATVPGVGRVDSGAIAESSSVSVPALHPLEKVTTGPKEGSTQPLLKPTLISIPCVIDGAIDHPGDVETYRFNVKAGEKLAFEIQTPEMQPPQFNPRFAVDDSHDHELFASVHRSVSLFNANADRHPYLKAVDPKVIYTFENGGEYVLRVRDVTSRYGQPDFRYRLLVRPQVPHVGEVTVADGDHLNLTRGEARKLTITTDYEEGFSGQVSFTFAGLPTGVQISPAAELVDDKAPADIDQNPERVAPKLEKTTVVLLVQPDAPLTSTPKVVRLICRPILDGKVGPSWTAREIPIMVVNTPSGREAAKAASGQ